MADYPKGIEARGNTLRIRLYHQGKEYSETIRCDPRDPHAIEAAVRRRDKMKQLAASGIDPTIERVMDAEHVDLSSAYAAMFIAARKRGKERRGYELRSEDEQKLVRRAAGRCAVSDIPLSVKKYGAQKAPFAPSLDRIDSSKPYSLENCRIVCTSVNFAMNEWGTWAFDRVARAYVSKILRTDMAATVDGAGSILE
jgi:hypothetical protein